MFPYRKNNSKFLSTQLKAAVAKPKSVDDYLNNPTATESTSNEQTNKLMHKSDRVDKETVGAVVSQAADKNRKQQTGINVINLANDTQRKEIGLEPSGLLGDDWKEIRVDYKQLLGNYSKLSKRNLTGMLLFSYFHAIYSHVDFKLVDKW